LVNDIPAGDGKIIPARESLVGDIQSGYGKIANLFYSVCCCTIPASKVTFGAFIRKLFHFSAIWRAFGVLMFLGAKVTRGGGGGSCVGLFYRDYSKSETIQEPN
jgi:hypothetical protein